MTVTENETSPPIEPAKPAELKDGRIVAIAGPVVDAEFPRGHLPEINTALEFTITVEGTERASDLLEADGRPDARHPREEPRPRPQHAGW
jgi:hypothetical protein